MDNSVKKNNVTYEAAFIITTAAFVFAMGIVAGVMGGLHMVMMTSFFGISTLSVIYHMFLKELDKGKQTQREIPLEAGSQAPLEVAPAPLEVPLQAPSEVVSIEQLLSKLQIFRANSQDYIPELQLDDEPRYYPNRSKEIINSTTRFSRIFDTPEMEKELFSNSRHYSRLHHHYRNEKGLVSQHSDDHHLEGLNSASRWLNDDIINDYLKKISNRQMKHMHRVDLACSDDGYLGLDKSETTYTQALKRARQVFNKNFDKNGKPLRSLDRMMKGFNKLYTYCVTGAHFYGMYLECGDDSMLTLKLLDGFNHLYEHQQNLPHKVKIYIDVIKDLCRYYYPDKPMQIEYLKVKRQTDMVNCGVVVALAGELHFKGILNQEHLDKVARVEGFDYEDYRDKMMLVLAEGSKNKRLR